jgi:hypothetical protein
VKDFSQVKRAVKRHLPDICYRSHRMGGTQDPRWPASASQRTWPRSQALRTIDKVRSHFSFVNYDADLIDRRLAGISVFDGLPGVTVLRDVWYIPEHPGLYGADGVRIDEAWFRRGPDKKEVWPPEPRTISPPATRSSIASPLIYLGFPYFPHYGHFLIESISRLWFAQEDRELPLLCHDLHARNPFKHSFVDAFFGAAPIDSKRLVSFREPVFLKEVLLPDPSLTGGAEGFTTHQNLPRAVSNSMVPDKTTTARPLYLSRSQLGKGLRTVRHETLLESELRVRGAEIVHPERLTLREQVELINRHEVVIGPMGSALHGLLFKRSTNSTVVYLGEVESLNHLFLTIDVIAENRATYIGAIEPDPTSSKTLSLRDVTLNLDIAMEGLRGIGIL